MRITRLGQGVDQDRRLGPDAIERTLAVLREYRAVMDAHGVRRVRMTATSAARDAANREDFFAAAAAASSGVRPELLAGDEEGRLSFRGCHRRAGARRRPPGWSPTSAAARPSWSSARTRTAARAPCAPSTSAACASPSASCTRTRPPPEELARPAGSSPSCWTTVSRRSTRPSARRPPWSAWPARWRPWPPSTRGSHYDRDRVHHYRADPRRGRGLLAALAAEPTAARRRRPGSGARPGRRDRRRDRGAGRADAPLRLRHCLTSEADILDGLVSHPALVTRDGRRGPRVYHLRPWW